MSDGWPWMVAALPALLLLFLIIDLVVPVPYADSWAFVEQYLDWVQDDYSWRNFFEKHGDHPSVIGKLVYFAALHLMAGNVALLPVLSWMLSLAVAVCVGILSKPVWKGKPVLGAVLMTCVSGVIFSTAQAGVWLWDFTFQNYIPGACLALGTLLLARERLGAWRILAAGALSVISTFSFGAGFLVGALFAVLLWFRMSDVPVARRVLLVGVWLAFNVVAAWVALKAFGPSGFTEEGPGVSPMVIFDRPLMRLEFVLVLLGQMFGKGTLFEPFEQSLLVGGLLLLMFGWGLVMVFRQRNVPGFVAAALPWIVFALYGLGNATLISIGRLGDSTDSFLAFNHIYALAERTMAERFVTLTLFFVFGVIMLVAVVVTRSESGPLRLFVTRRLATPALLVFLALSVLNWVAGRRLMELESILMKQERAMLGFGTFLRLDGDRLWNKQMKYHTFELAKNLAEMGRLRGVEFVQNPAISSFRRGNPASPRWSGLDKPELLEDGNWSLEGTCGLPNDDMDGLPHLVLVSAESPGNPEEVVALAAPQLPETFLERQSQRRKYPDHYFRWTESISPSLFPLGKVTLRAYAYDARAQTVRPMRGEYTIENAKEASNVAR